MPKRSRAAASTGTRTSIPDRRALAPPETPTIHTDNEADNALPNNEVSGAMHIRKHRILASVALTSLSLLPLPGCSGGGAAEQPVSPATSRTQQLKAIDDNTHMPPEVKAAAKEAILHHQDRK